RKELQNGFEAVKEENNALKKQLQDLKQNLLPLGFTYVQLPKDKAPGEIWPWATWTDVSSTYAGVFFRVEGGAAAPFGTVQESNTTTLSHIHSQDEYESWDT